MTPPAAIEQYWRTRGFHGLASRTALRTLQFVFAIVAAALYGVDLARWTRSQTDASSQWSVAEVVAALSAVTCIVHCFVTVTRVAWCVWDAVLALVWAVMAILAAQLIFGGDELLGRDKKPIPYNVAVLKAAFFIDLVCMGLWLVTVAEGLMYCCTARKSKRRKTVISSGMEMMGNGKHGELENE